MKSNFDDISVDSYNFGDHREEVEFATREDGEISINADNITSQEDLNITTGTDKTLVLENVVYDDIPISFDSAKVPAANAPTWTELVTGINAYTFAVNDYLEVTAEMLHGYKEGEDIEVHLHGATNGLDATDRFAKWELNYSIKNDS